MTEVEREGFTCPRRASSYPVMDARAIAHIGGNGTKEMKALAVRWYDLLGGLGPQSYGYNVRKALEIKEVSFEPSADIPEKFATKLVCELVVTQEMCNALKILDQGCITFLMDEGSAISLLMMSVLQGGVDQIGVSQTFNIILHASVPVGSRIRIISRSVSTEKHAGCCQTDIWDITNNKLAVSGKQIQTNPSKPRVKAKI